jgi:hypothetical protein
MPDDLKWRVNESDKVELSMFFTGEPEITPSDETIYWAIEAAIKEIEDINAIAAAHGLAQLAKRQKQESPET